MNWVLLTILISSVVFSFIGLLAFGWAARNGQMTRLERGSIDIFDEGEPIGKVTDAFPNEKLKFRNR